MTGPLSTTDVGAFVRTPADGCRHADAVMEHGPTADDRRVVDAMFEKARKRRASPRPATARVEAAPARIVVGFSISFQDGDTSRP